MWKGQEKLFMKWFQKENEMVLNDVYFFVWFCHWKGLENIVSGLSWFDSQHLIKTHHLKHSEDLQKAAVLQDLQQLQQGLKEQQNVFNVQVSSSFGSKPARRRPAATSSQVWSLMHSSFGCIFLMHKTSWIYIYHTGKQWPCLNHCTQNGRYLPTVYLSWYSKDTGVACPNHFTCVKFNRMNFCQWSYLCLQSAH